MNQGKDTIKNTINIIHGAGGSAILAHPMLYDNHKIVINRFIECGGDCIEVDYFYENRDVGESEAREKVKWVGDIAREKGLVISGGGDFHSDADPHEIGEFGLSLDEFEKLREYWRLGKE